MRFTWTDVIIQFVKFMTLVPHIASNTIVYFVVVTATVVFSIDVKLSIKFNFLACLLFFIISYTNRRESLEHF